MEVPGIKARVSCQLGAAAKRGPFTLPDGFLPRGDAPCRLLGSRDRSAAFSGLAAGYAAYYIPITNGRG